MSFSDPRWLLGLLALPVLALFEALALRRAEQATKLLVGARADHVLLAQRRPLARRLGLVLRLGALALLAVGAAGPQWGRETVRRHSRGYDLVFVIDVSASMDARDVAPSRLDEARREAMSLLERVAGSRVAVVAFAGDAVRLCPLTLDQAAVHLTLESLRTDLVSSPGTDIGRALAAARKLLPAGHRSEQAIVLWTDGEDLEGHAGDAIDGLKSAGIRVFAVGVGTAAGDVVPVADETGRVVDAKRDERGQIVRSRLDEALLGRLARGTQGAYFGASRAGGELPRLLGAVGTLARGSTGSRLVERPVARFGGFALAAALLLLAELARERRRTLAAAAGRAAAVLALLALSAAQPRAAFAQSAWARGDQAFRAGHYTAAESLYAKRLGRDGPAAVRVNLATARARNGRAEQAERELQHLTAQPGATGQMAGYNLGTLYAERHDTDRALGELRRALERDPGDADARWNYEMMMQEKQRPKGGGGGQPPPTPSQPDPKSQPGASPQSRPQPQPAGGPGQSPNNPGAPQGSGPAPGAGGAPGMTRQQAEQLLRSLQDLESLERRTARASAAARERKGKDW